MKKGYSLFCLLAGISFASMCQAHPAEGKYINLLKSGKYQLICTIESREMLADISNRALHEYVLIENNVVKEEMVDVLQYLPKNPKPYVHNTYFKKNGIYYDDFQKGKKKEDVLDIHLNMRGKLFMQYPQGGYSFSGKCKNDWDKEFENSKVDVLKYLGPIVAESKKIPNYETKLLGQGTMLLDGLKLNYEEYQLMHETGARLRLFYNQGQLVRVLKLISNTTDHGFIMGVKRENNSFIDVKVNQFDDKIDKIPVISSND